MAECLHITEKLILNAFESEQPENVLPAHTMSDDMEACQVSVTTLQGEHTQKIVEDGAEITLPIGYGMTPFLKLRYVLETIFNGYTLNTSAIQLVCDVFENKMCLINNVADTICSGTLKFVQLIPEISIKEFIDKTEKMFAGKFIINEFTKTVTFNTYNEKLTIHADLDLSNYLVSSPKLGTPDFTTVVVKYKSDNVISTNEAQTKTELLEFDFLNRINTKMSKLFRNSAGSAYYYVDLTLYLLQITDIIHKNTSVVIAGKTITEEQKTSNLVQIMTIDGHTNSSFYYVVPPNVFGYPIFYTAMQYIDLHPDIDSFYSAYKSFRLNSNIPIEVEMNIPDQVLETLNFSIPKILQGQKVMIESIVQKLGKKDIQKVKFRTLRSYQ